MLCCDRFVVFGYESLVPTSCGIDSLEVVAHPIRLGNRDQRIAIRMNDSPADGGHAHVQRVPERIPSRIRRRKSSRDEIVRRKLGQQRVEIIYTRGKQDALHGLQQRRAWLYAGQGGVEKDRGEDMRPRAVADEVQACAIKHGGAGQERLQRRQNIPGMLRVLDIMGLWKL